jgi:lipid-A-disaccharide synthase-like uncharacterized protein
MEISPLPRITEREVVSQLVLPQIGRCLAGSTVFSQIGNYLYEVFVAKFDFWLAFGLGAQMMFTARFLVQWITSEVMGKSVVPMAFWFFSIAGGLMTLAYGLVKREPVIIVGQLFGTIVYTRNIMLIFKEKSRKAANR